jgi:hypothetical protein
LNICPQSSSLLKFVERSQALSAGADKARDLARAAMRSRPHATPEEHAVRIPRSTLAVAITLIALALPASASAAQPSHVVVLNVTPTDTCERTILDVTMTYSIVPATIYTDALCGFAASLSTRKARDLASDPRVQSVTEDRRYTTG